MQPGTVIHPVEAKSRFLKDTRALLYNLSQYDAYQHFLLLTKANDIACRPQLSVSST